MDGIKSTHSVGQISDCVLAVKIKRMTFLDEMADIQEGSPAIRIDIATLVAGICGEFTATIITRCGFNPVKGLPSLQEARKQPLDQRTWIVLEQKNHYTLLT